jgi:HEAT repeats
MLLAIIGAVPTWGAVDAGTDGIGVWDPDGLVAQLRGMPPILWAPMGGICAEQARCQPPMPSVEAKRMQVYEELYRFGISGVPALARLLNNSDDVTSKRNALLALEVLGGGWYFSTRSPSRIDIAAALPALVAALRDSDATVRAWAAESIGNAGPSGVDFVPQLEALLSDPDEAVRIGACLGLRRMGPAASEALPALQRRLLDPSKDVRSFAQLAIGATQGIPYPLIYR